MLDRLPVICLTICLAFSSGPAAASTSGELNAYRAAANLPPLRENRQLARAAMSHARDMAANGFFAHRGSDGSNHNRRIRAAGYRVCGAGENIAWGHKTRAGAMKAWMGSPGHRRIMLDPTVVEFGYAEINDRQVLVVARPC